ncbi:MAG: thiosulfate oxidation carrier complex protein SoxZ [Candidatus Muproteobacteria bacterium RIFCSPHIGHO2_12_FULL_60_33]|uniref:Thiosulfate oxidation carrier complex protein SoxZ n=1 Tax=Candidatus Muproteobacteria bacterium RIFCSPLOWO2_01_FULL_60_18 TaxID=1817768 RepID=A0A1F6TWP1_9PROT|nr:MAG: thiosulfate oxidation carrier complex protein SoxZ [Candidatus Muproteobacteria bacterium RIFCSPHIGHO2_01_60_12]OGI49531.1 MAG: thiosulfate oxidation carrier complex protein SoxZ [Candidatus Muproteobacteria bacterium RIFCSPLOWO2_01_FULL_60_18]OGI55391.1 MAG: thiosulfate oxidation carrier complex protein SoxZ [Candidatus Muproteobacteria bacterium RIFCSPHIGHO2_12_FULL_60_33]
MADIQTKIRTKTQGDVTDVLVLVDHPMETGQRPDPKDKDKKVPAHYIQKLTFSVNGKEVVSSDLGPAVSKDPLVGIKLKGAKPGDKIQVNWSDNTGKSGSGEATVG